MTPLIVRYPLDPTGTNPNNLVTGEIQNLTPNRNVRAIATLYGAFFTQSLVVTDTATNQVLTPGTQYYAAELYELPTARYGKEICAVILITDPTVSNQVSLQYQALGGPYGTSATAIVQQIENLQLDTRPVAWGDILDRPSEFPPAFHLHDIGDVYGFEYLVHAIDRVRDAIEVGDSAQFSQIYAYIDHINSVLTGSIASSFAAFQAHLNDFNNPHRVTPAQLGVYTMAQSDTNLANAINPVSAALTAHEADYNNPHHTTAAQVGAYTTAQVDAKLQALQTALTLPFTPVQQGTGFNQGTNTVKIGWGTGGSLRLTVDATDLGFFPRSTTADGTFTYNGSIWATGNVGSTSDRRLKKDIKTLENALDRLEAITGCTWLMDDGRHGLKGDPVRRTGVIAQDVQKVLPEAVTVGEDGYLAVAYGNMIGLVIEAIKELRRDVVALKQ